MNRSGPEETMDIKRNEHLTLAKLASAARILDEAGMYEDACAIDDLLEAVAESGDMGILKEAGMWTNFLARLSGGARRLLFREYRQAYRNARDAQAQLENRLSQLADQAKALRRQLKLHDLQGWRTGLAGMVSDVSIPDFDALTRYDQQYNAMLRQVFKHQLPAQPKPQDVSTAPAGEGGRLRPVPKSAVPPVLPEDYVDKPKPPLSEREVLENLEKQHGGGGERPLAGGGDEPRIEPAPPPTPEDADIPDMTEHVTEVPEPGADVEPGRIMPDDAEVEPAAPPASGEPEEEVSTDELSDKQFKDIQTNPKVLPSDEQTPEPAPAEEVSDEERAEIQDDSWVKREFGPKKAPGRLVLEVSEAGDKMRMTLDAWHNLVMGKDATTQQGRPLLMRAGKVIPSGGTASHALIDFMGPYWWEPKIMDEMVYVSKTEEPLNMSDLTGHTRARLRPRVLEIQQQVEKLRQLKKEESLRRRSRIAAIAAPDEHGRKSRLLRLAADPLLDEEGDPDEDKLMEAAEEFLSGLGE